MGSLPFSHNNITRVLVLLIFVLLSSTTFASTVEQQSFSQLGWKPLIVNGAQKESCTESFLYAPKNTSGNFVEVVSLHVQFAPIPSGDAIVSLYWNDANKAFQTWKASEVQHNWIRATVAKGSIPSEGHFFVCLKNSNAITSSTLLDDSSIGLYQSPAFEPGVDFTKTTSVQNAVVGKEFTVTVTAHNSGAEAANVHIGLVDESEIVKQLRGTTSFDGVIEPGKSAQFSYVVKPYYARPQYIAVGEPVPITLPSAVLTYTNEFGETVSLESSRPTVSVREPEFKVVPTLLPEKQRINVGETTTVLVALQNQGKEDIDNVSVFIQPPKGLEVNQPGLGSVSIRAGETKTLQFQAKATQEGKQTMRCVAIYVDDQAKYSNCDPTTVDVKGTGNNGVLTAAAILLVIGAFIYTIIYFR